MKTALEIVADERAAGHFLRRAVNKKQDSIAGFDDGRWVAVATIGINGKWLPVRFELCVNGKSLWEQSDWVEVPLPSAQDTEPVDRWGGLS
jgi:hypothetical protein